MAKTFDENMTKIKTLVGASESHFKLYEQNIKGIAQRTGQSMNSVSDALFAVTSAGVKGDKALELLTMASKASAVGMGEVKDIARATTGIMNAYKKENMSATHAMNVFKKVVEQGNLEASELAPTLGRVVGMAQTMGISFEEVGASIATFTRLGVDSASAVTGLRSIMAGLASPTQEAKDTMAEFGLSAEGLREKLSTDGLAGTLEMLMEATGGNIDSLSSLFPNIRALTAVLGTAGSQGQAYKDVLAEIKNSHGALDEAFQETEKSSSFKLKQAMNGISASMNEMGAVIMPMVASAIAKISNLFSNAVASFTSLDSNTQLLIGSLAGVTLALPMIISLFGSLLSVIGAVLSPVGLLVAGLSAVAFVIYNEWDGIKKILVDLANFFIDLYNESLAFAMIIHGIGAFFKTLFDIAVAVVDGMVNAFKTGVGILKDLFGGLGSIIKGVLTLDPDEIGKGFKEVGTAISDNLKLSVDTYNEIFAKAGDSAVKNFTEAMDSALTRDKVELIDEEDIDNFVGKGADMANGLLDQIKGIFKGNTIEIPTPEFKTPPTPDDGSVGDPESDEGDGVITDLEKRETGFRNFLEQSGEALNANMLSNAENFASQMANSTNPLKAFAGSLMQTAMKQIAVSKAVSTANAVQSGTETGKNMPFGAFLIPALIAGLMAVVSKSMAKVPAFAKGGIVGGPTLGLMGEYAGARSNPEVIAPLDRLNSMINSGGSQDINVGGQFEISGENLVLALERTRKTRSRYTQ
tara:strand:+ start:6177 stop:8429 length:2253 start_codon:yes stop_codon:yes gene_type:complete